MSSSTAQGFRTSTTAPASNWLTARRSPSRRVICAADRWITSRVNRLVDEVNRLFADYRFNEAYQDAVEARKVADQVAEQNKSAAKAAEEEYLKKHYGQEYSVYCNRVRRYF
jgi:valyl-tRNA synthetase